MKSRKNSLLKTFGSRKIGLLSGSQYIRRVNVRRRPGGLSPAR
jgi:hypothetical protein